MIVGVLTICHKNTLEIAVYVFFMVYVPPFPQLSRNWRYDSEPPLKSSPLTCNKQFGTNSIIVLMFVESQRVHI